MVDYEKLEHICYDLLLAIGEDPEREGLQQTPARFARSWREFIEYDSGTIDTCFEAITTNQMVVVSGMRVWSFCEHHLLPFWCDISIGYIAREKVLGLSKFARIAHKHAHKLQLQERLCHDIAHEIITILGTEDVAVIAQGEHSCMVSRGARTPGLMKSSVLNGFFLHNHDARMELFQLIK